MDDLKLEAAYLAAYHTTDGSAQDAHLAGLRAVVALPAVARPAVAADPPGEREQNAMVCRADVLALIEEHADQARCSGMGFSANALEALRRYVAALPAAAPTIEEHVVAEELTRWRDRAMRAERAVAAPASGPSESEPTDPELQALYKAGICDRLNHNQETAPSDAHYAGLRAIWVAALRAGAAGPRSGEASEPHAV